MVLHVLVAPVEQVSTGVAVCINVTLLVHRGAAHAGVRPQKSGPCVRTQAVMPLLSPSSAFPAHASRLPLSPPGILACFSRLTDASLFLVLYGLTAVYFSGVMVGAGQGNVTALWLDGSKCGAGPSKARRSGQRRAGTGEVGWRVGLDSRSAPGVMVGGVLGAGGQHGVGLRQSTTGRMASGHHRCAPCWVDRREWDGQGLDALPRHR